MPRIQPVAPLGIISTVALALAAIVAAPAVAQDEAPLATRRVASGLQYPTGVFHAPGDETRLFITEKPGRIRILDLTNGQVLSSPFLNIDPLVNGGTSTNSEQGLLGLAFHPDYASNGYFYVNYTGSGGATNVRRYTVSDSDPNVADASSGTTILTIGQPYSNHNGGWIAFGPDGYLYIGTGDGGAANDPGNRAQNIGNNQLLGKMLRIDVDGASPYAIPPDNPFANGGGDARIWSYGLRNPWRCTFDRETGDLWIADVGQNAWEEINFQPAGEGGQNYGWRCKEGDACTGLSGCSCSSPSLTNPIHVYAHNFNGGYSVSGGVVYRGCKIGGLPGTYFFADYVTGRIWSMRYDGTSVLDFQLRTSELSPSLEGITVNQIVSFGEDATGEMYIVDQGSGSSGQIFRVIAADGSDACESGPIGDLNDDGVVNGADLGILLASWGACPPKGPCIADLNDDGVVNGADLGIQLGNWTG